MLQIHYSHSEATWKEISNCSKVPPEVTILNVMGLSRITCHNLTNLLALGGGGVGGWWRWTTLIGQAGKCGRGQPKIDLSPFMWAIRSPQILLDCFSGISDGKVMEQQKRQKLNSGSSV